MKTILTGANGFIGHEILTQCLLSPGITSIIALTRRDLPLQHPKLAVCKTTDFLNYSDAVLREIEGAEACIWALGKARMSDMASARKIHIDYTLAAARAFGTRASATGKTFRFVYLSGGGAERDQSKSLWFMQDYRRVRGQVENELLAYAGSQEEHFETYIMRPGMVLAKEMNVRDWVRGFGPSVRVDVLARVMVDVAVEGSGERVWENDGICGWKC